MDVIQKIEMLFFRQGKSISQHKPTTTQNMSSTTDVAFHCYTCQVAVIRDSETHDYSKCDPYAEDNWYCPECPVPDSEDEDEEVEEVDRA